MRFLPSVIKPDICCNIEIQDGVLTKTLWTWEKLSADRLITEGWLHSWTFTILPLSQTSSRHLHSKRWIGSDYRLYDIYQFCFIPLVFYSHSFALYLLCCYSHSFANMIVQVWMLVLGGQYSSGFHTVVATPFNRNVPKYIIILLTRHHLLLCCSLYMLHCIIYSCTTQK